MGILVLRLFYRNFFAHILFCSVKPVTCTKMAKQPTKKTARKTAAKKAAAPAKKATKVAAKKSVPAKKATVKKAAARKAAPKKTTAKKATAKKAAARKVESPKTTIIARYDAGFGNQLYLRGSGGGLSWEQGQLMENTQADEWIWETGSASGELEFKVLLNDTEWSNGQNGIVFAGATVVFEPEF